MADDAKDGATPSVDEKPKDQKDATSDGSEDEPLGEKGTLALAREREARQLAESTAKEATRQLKAIEKRLADIESAGKTDQQKIEAERDRLKSRLDDLTTKQREAAGRESIRQAARSLGAPEDKRDLIFRSVRTDLAFDDDGEPENAEQLVTDLKELYPDLFKAAASKADAGAGNKTKPKEDMNAWLRRVAQTG